MDIAPADCPVTVTYQRLRYNTSYGLWKEDRDVDILWRISTKQCNIILDPLKSNPLILHAEVESTSLRSLGSGQEVQESIR